MRKCVLFISGVRCPQPLDSATAKKFAALNQVADSITIGYATGLRPRYFEQSGEFYLMPNVRFTLVRCLLMLLVAPLLGFVIALRRRVSAVMAQSPYQGLTALMIVRAAQLFGHPAKLIVESHGDFEESLFYYRKVPAETLVRSLMRYAARFVIQRADALRAVSNTTSLQLLQYAPKSPIQQFPSWTDFDVFRSVQRHPWAQKSGLILYAGVLSPLKGVHHLIAAFSRICATHPDARLVIAGKTIDDAYERDLKSAIAGLRLGGRIELAGHLSQRDLADLLATAALLVLPSYSEGLPRVVMEAMGAGVPVIATPVGGLPELIEDGHTGYLVPPGDERALGDRMSAILGDPESASRIAGAARARALRVFSTEEYVNGYQTLLERAICVAI